MGRKGIEGVPVYEHQEVEVRGREGLTRERLRTREAVEMRALRMILDLRWMTRTRTIVRTNPSLTWVRYKMGTICSSSHPSHHTTTANKGVKLKRSLIVYACGILNVSEPKGNAAYFFGENCRFNLSVTQELTTLDS